MQPMTRREKAAATVAAIQARYPDPVTRPSLINNQYCVTVAVCQYDSEMLDQIGAMTLRMIICVNDRGDFEDAWELVEDALAA